MFTTFFFSIKKTTNKHNHLSLYILLLKKKIVPVIFQSDRGRTKGVLMPPLQVDVSVEGVGAILSVLCAEPKCDEKLPSGSSTLRLNVQNRTNQIGSEFSQDYFGSVAIKNNRTYFIWFGWFSVRTDQNFITKNKQKESPHLHHILYFESCLYVIQVVMIYNKIY